MTVELDPTRRAVLERALADWVRRDQLLDPRHGIAVIPIRLFGEACQHHLGDVVDQLAGPLHVCGTLDEPWPGATLPDSFVHVCILDVAHDGSCPWLDRHVWLDCQRDAAQTQFDPLERIARRAKDAAGILANPFDVAAR